ncbi:MAG TPA: hypothetical protein VK469_14415, partial [Candidatus Kapabacteria bacterium]|nr:hypothetical protein [Candidatus Kapabacteria bacterium]
DFSAYAPYDLEMYHEDRPLANGIMLEDMTGRRPQKEEIIYTGIWISDSPTPVHLNLLNGPYNCVKVGFQCGTIVLPLPGSLDIDSTKGKQLQKVELTISILNAAICRFTIKLSCPGWMLEHCYEQPIVSMGHIVRNS